MSTVFNSTELTPIQVAISVGPDVRDWLTNTRTPRILNIFERACNLVNERGEVISLVSQEVGNGPFNLVFSPQSSGPMFSQINSFTPVSICWPGLKIGKVLIDLRQSIQWNAKPDWSDLVEDKYLIITNLLCHMNWLIREANPHSLLSLFSQTTNFPDHRLEYYIERQKLIGWMNCLFKSVQSLDLDGCRAAGKYLAGLGLGLTPAGDDLLLGAIIAAWIIHPYKKAERIASTIASAAITRTNSLSAAWIIAVARGLVNENWYDFLNNSRTEGFNPIESSLRRLLTVGHTSGADALAGFIGCSTRGMAYFESKLQPEDQNDYELNVPSFAVPLWD